MDELDNRLQKNLEILETGQVGPTPNGDDQEIEALIHLAASIREVTGPQMSPEKVRKGRQQAMNLALASDQMLQRRSKRSSSNQLAWLAIVLIPATIALASFGLAAEAAYPARVYAYLTGCGDDCRIY